MAAPAAVTFETDQNPNPLRMELVRSPLEIDEDGFVRDTRDRGSRLRTGRSCGQAIPDRQLRFANIAIFVDETVHQPAV
jgi:hypothetical protein